MSKPKTAEQWLALDDLPTELAKVLTPGPWKHETQNRQGGICHKCWKRPGFNIPRPGGKFCSVPDPITIDWNTAKYWQGKCDEDTFDAAMREIHAAVESYDPPRLTKHGFYDWREHRATIEQRLIAAATAAERKRDG